MRGSRRKEVNIMPDKKSHNEFIEEMARERLDMYYPNEKVYVDKGM